MNEEKAKKVLKVCGWIFVVLVLLDVLSLVVTIVSPEMSLSTFATEAGISEKTAKVVLGIVYGIIGIIALCKTYLSNKAFRVANGNTKASGVKFPIFILVVLVFGLVLDITNISSIKDCLPLVKSVISIVIMALYIKALKELKPAK